MTSLFQGEGTVSFDVDLQIIGGSTVTKNPDTDVNISGRTELLFNRVTFSYAVKLRLNTD